jgi:HPt (histidine-containing phosphotransfer) domain-containing protein
LGRAIAAGKTEDVAAFAHKIKGAALNLNLAVVAEQSRNIENAARKGSLDNAPASFARLEKAVRDVSALVEDTGNM